MPSEHARLGPSAAERWMACPASVRLSAEVPGYVDSVYAREGTAAHELAELLARHAVAGTPAKHDLLTWRLGHHGEFDTEEIEIHAWGYADMIVRRATKVPGTAVFFEERVLPGVPQCFGTADAILVSPDGRIEIVDFKYGAGVHVSAQDNPQLMLYGLGALEGYGDLVCDTTEVVCTIYQPRVNEEPSSQSWTPAALREWRDHRVLPLAEEALSETGRFNPGETQCRWCPAAGICRPRMEAATAEDFSADPDIVSDEELGAIMGRLSGIREWANAVEAVVFRKVYELGHPVPGWKAVQTEGRRGITDHPEALRRLEAAGYPAEKTTRTTAKPLGELEKLVGKALLPGVLGETLQKSDGKKALAPEADPRPAISPGGQAAVDFKEDL